MRAALLNYGNVALLEAQMRERRLLHAITDGRELDADLFSRDKQMPDLAASSE